MSQVVGSKDRRPGVPYLLEEVDRLIPVSGSVGRQGLVVLAAEREGVVCARWSWRVLTACCE